MRMVVYGILAMAALAGCATTAVPPRDWMDVVEQTLALGAASWAVLRFVFTPLLTQLVRKAITEEVRRLEELHTAHADLDHRVERMEDQVRENTKAIQAVPQLREALATTKVSIDRLNEVLERLLDQTSEHTKEIGQLQGRLRHDE